MTDICVGNLIVTGSDNGLSPGQRQAITWTNAALLSIDPLRTNFSEILIEIHVFFQGNVHENVVREMAAICLGLNVLKILWDLFLTYFIMSQLIVILIFMI